MRLFTTIAALRCYLNSLSSQQHAMAQSPAALSDSPSGVSAPKIGLVPTMGALHEGHLSLIQQARQDHSIVVVSIFVNSLQFGEGEDFHQYPRPLEQDQKLCEEAGVDVIFAPSAAEMGIETAPHSPSPTMVVPPAAMTSGLCGRTRVGHFQGVATIVTKLLNLVQPTAAYFGQKDAQQLAIIQRLVTDLNVPVEIVSCPIVREPSGLAYSSRNQYLTSEQKLQASGLYQALRQAEHAFNQGEHSATSLKAIVTANLATIDAIQLEYVELVDPKTLSPVETLEESGLLAIAAWCGATRLIDNLILRCRQPIVAIDGPAGSGKSTVTRLVAQALGLLYLDSGAMYRAVTWLVLKSGIPLEDEPSIAELVNQCQISFQSQGKSSSSPSPQAYDQILINGEDCTEVIRSQEVTAKVSAIAAQGAVRQTLVKQQRQLGVKGGIVAEGRDIGTNVFPDAELKVFLTASVQERARRRYLELQQRGKSDVDLEQLEQDIALRDQKDSSRDIAPLRKAADAIEIQTDGLTIDQVRDQIVSLYHQKRREKV